MRIWQFPCEIKPTLPPVSLYSLFVLNHGRTWIRVSDASYSRVNAMYVFHDRIISESMSGKVMDIREVSL